MLNRFLMTLERRDRLSDVERTLVEEIGSRRRHFAAKTDIVREGSSPTESCLMISGFSARYNLLGDGKRQITAVHVAGDFVDLHSFLLDRMDHSVLALTDCIISTVPHEFLKEVSRNHPHFIRILWMLTAIDAAIYRRWLVAAGRLSSAGQIAHFLCELHTRLSIVGLADGDSFQLPMSQTDLSDAMGLSVVHVNRTLQQMRRKRLIVWQNEQVRILDIGELKRLCEFDPIYLNLRQIPR